MSRRDSDDPARTRAEAACPQATGTPQIDRLIFPQKSRCTWHGIPLHCGKGLLRTHSGALWLPSKTMMILLLLPLLDLLPLEEDGS